MHPENIRTNETPTWCPGCFNFQVLAGVQQFLEEQFKKGKKKEEFASLQELDATRSYLTISMLQE